MLACRRLQAQPEDFLQALHEHSLSLRSLLPHLEPPVEASKTQFRLRSEAVRDNDEKQAPSLPNSGSDMTSNAVNYIPSHFPKLPSRHTYKATAEYPDRQYDAREIREKATEEGRLGEEALRRFVGAVSERSLTRSSLPHRKKSLLEQKDAMWRKTMQQLSISDTSSQEGESGLLISEGGRSIAWTGHLGSAVNAEKKYWRTPVRKVGAI